MTKTAVRDLRAFRISSFWFPSTFGICHSSFITDSSRPDESSDQFVVCVFCFGGPAHGTRDLDATPKERRLGSRIWRGCHGKHFRRTDDERARKIHDLAGWHFLRAYIWVVGFVRASGYWRRERVPTRAHETARSARNFSRLFPGSTFTRFFSSEFADSGFSGFFSGAHSASNSYAIIPAFR
jgi:hypothetical protein